IASRKVLAPRTAVYHDGRGSEPMIDVGSVFPAEALNIFLGPPDHSVQWANVDMHQQPRFSNGGAGAARLGPLHLNEQISAGMARGLVEKIPGAGGEHAIIRQRRVETPITVIITTALAQRNNAGDAIGKYPGGCSLAQRKPSDQRSLRRSLGARRERNLSRHQKIFCKNVFHTKATPFMRAEPFLGKFLGEGP